MLILFFFPCIPVPQEYGVRFPRREKGVKVNRFLEHTLLSMCFRNVSSCTCVPACVGGFGSLPGKGAFPILMSPLVGFLEGCMCTHRLLWSFSFQILQSSASYCEVYMSDECTLLKYILSSFHLGISLLICIILCHFLFPFLCFSSLHPSSFSSFSPSISPSLLLNPLSSFPFIFSFPHSPTNSSLYRNCKVI